MKFSDILGAYGKDKCITSKDIGIEIEVEGRNLPKIDNSYWVTVKDGSLRGESYEYVSNGPQYLNKVPLILKSLKNRLKDSELNLSYRTSVHIHMNMTQETLQTIQSTVYLYLLFEDALLNYAGESRKGNRFCLGFKDAEGLVGSVLQYLTPNTIMHVNGEEVRYASINIASLPKYGTLEFRALRGTVDEKVLLPWINILFKLREIARYVSPEDIYNLSMKKGTEGFARDTLQEYFNIYYYDSMYEDIDYNRSCLIDIPFKFTTNALLPLPQKRIIKQRIILDEFNEEGEEEQPDEEDEDGE